MQTLSHLDLLSKPQAVHEQDCPDSLRNSYRKHDVQWLTRQLEVSVVFFCLSYVTMTHPIAEFRKICFMVCIIS